MENYKLLIYLIIGILYLIFKNRKKNSPVADSPIPPVPRPNTVPQKSAPIKRQETLEKAKSIARKRLNMEEEGAYQSAKRIDYDDLIADEEGKIIVPKMSDADREAQERFEPYSGKDKNENEYSKLLKNPESLKQAMVMSEILTPKHF